MNRSLKLSILMALALGSTQAAAVELGQAHVKSALGQPLLVEIPVTQATPAELQSLSAELASNDAFAKAGGERPTIPLTFTVADVSGHKVIRITSSTSVDDPYLDLLVQVTSATGSSVREFAILLDPPSKVEQAAASSAPTRHRAPASSASAPSGTAAAARRQTTPAPSQHAAAAIRNGQYTVEKGQTLSHVAVETAQAGVDKNQMMLALKAANPDAFYRDNINALKAGAVLRIPSHDDATAVAAAEAAATVRQQDSDWRNGSVAAAPVAVATGGTRSNASVAPTASSNADRLALVPPGSEGQSAGGSNGKANGNAAIRQELQRSQETLSSLEQQSNDLKSRLKDLEDLNSKNQRLLSLKDNEIADLQKKLADARKSAGLPPAPVATPAPAKPAQPVASAPTHAVTAPNPALAGLANANKPASTPATAATAPHPAVVTTPLTTPASKPASRPVHRVVTPAAEEQPWYMQPWALGAGGLVVVLALVGLLRRGKSGAKPAKAPPLGSSKGSLADRFGTADEDHPAGSDPDQDELLDQLAEHPDDIASHLELVSLYYTRRDVEHFEAAAEAMHAHITDPDQPEWQDVVHMGEDLAPGHPLFAQTVIPPSTHDEQSPLHHFDLDSYGAKQDSDSTVARNAPPQPSKVSEYHFDFDLTPHHAESPAQATHATATAVKPEQEPVSTWNFEEPAESAQAPHADHAEHEADFGELHDDPIDTKLDLARAYLDMGDPDGARAMLDEVMQEGTQMQKDVAKTLMAKIH
ncbi:FimV/HubP family polar landmark protein [Dyella psychrodurans]|uniref:Fimbrial protein FimV n=1 Tax=Dyella psychrodurans TaxID=1927960 RepID=A0A370XBE8_9GAMM|nr:FimV/HubP family polar landmark protein [Dyella psychrodurans]RDS85744.1 fimbrial protein FimV [Dyella psychrodurans]